VELHNITGLRLDLVQGNQTGCVDGYAPQTRWNQGDYNPERHMLKYKGKVALGGDLTKDGSNNDPKVAVLAL
jgi:hypothetical protein